MKRDIDRNGIDRIQVVNVHLLTTALRANDPRLGQLPKAGVGIDQIIDHDGGLHPLLIERLIKQHDLPIAKRVLWIIGETNFVDRKRPFERM